MSLAKSIAASLSTTRSCNGILRSWKGSEIWVNISRTLSRSDLSTDVPTLFFVTFSIFEYKSPMGVTSTARRVRYRTESPRPSGQPRNTSNQTRRSDMDRPRWFLAVAALATLPLIGATSTSSKKTVPDAAPAPVAQGMPMLAAKALAAHDQFLASDLLEGRGPCTRGDEIAEQYIAAQFESYGLQPGGDNGTYYQNVPLLGIATDRDKSALAFTKNGSPIAGPLKFRDQIVGQNQTQTESPAIDPDPPFLSHGILAPQHHWDH